LKKLFDMAVTIHQTPKSFNPSDNPVVWTFSSDQTAQPNFVYVVQLYINDTLVANELAFPENNINARFDASGYASNACSIPTIGDDLIADAANYCEVRITVVERYGTPPADQANSAASNVVCWKAKMFDDDWIDWTPADYIYNGPGLWLTNYPETMKVRLADEQIRLMFINNETSIVNFKVELFNTGGSIVSATVNFTATSYMLLICNVSPSVIISAMAITAENFAAADYYEVSANGVTGLAVQRIDIDTDCVFSTYKRLHFLTQFGAIESYSFGLIARKSGSITSYGYRKTFGQWDGSDFIWTKDQGRDIDYAKSIDRKMVCVSDWLSGALQNWIIYNLHGSPLVYEESGDLMIRRRCTNKTIDEKIQENDQLFLEEVTLTLPTHNSMVI
jgi:hypothetical protein